MSALVGYRRWSIEFNRQFSRKQTPVKPTQEAIYGQERTLTYYWIKQNLKNTASLDLPADLFFDMNIWLGIDVT